MLPAERKGSFFDKVINFFKSIFKTDKTHTEENMTIENEMPNEEQSDENNIRQQEEIEGDMDNEEYMNEQQNEEYENQGEQVED